MSTGDETYLEAFMESLGTLPQIIRRNMDLVKDLDATSSKQAEELRQLQQNYLQKAEDLIMQLEVVHIEDGRIALRLPQPHEKDTSNNATDATSTAGIPTTAELFQYTYQPDMYSEINKLHAENLQKAEENIATAYQTYHMVDATVQRLDRDLAAMEKLLQSSGDFHSGSSAKPDDLAACQISPGSEWILARVLHHDPNTGMYKLSDEDLESNKIFHLPESQVVLCGVEKLSRGDMVFAVYPDTTSFYQASVVQAPRKTGGSGTSARNFVMVNFVDDSDEFGITHDKAIPLQHIILPPHGAMLQ